MLYKSSDAALIQNFYIGEIERDFRDFSLMENKHCLILTRSIYRLQVQKADLIMKQQFLAYFTSSEMVRMLVCNLQFYVTGGRRQIGKQNINNIIVDSAVLFHSIFYYITYLQGGEAELMCGGPLMFYNSLL